MQIFFKVILPLAAPVLAVIGLLSFITTQAEFLLADVIIGPNDETSRRSPSGCRISCSPASTIGGDRSPPAR